MITKMYGQVLDCQESEDEIETLILLSENPQYLQTRIFPKSLIQGMGEIVENNFFIIEIENGIGFQNTKIFPCDLSKDIMLKKFEKEDIFEGISHLPFFNKDDTVS